MPNSELPILPPCLSQRSPAHSSSRACVMWHSRVTTARSTPLERTPYLAGASRPARRLEPLPSKPTGAPSAGSPPALTFQTTFLSVSFRTLLLNDPISSTGSGCTVHQWMLDANLLRSEFTCPCPVRVLAVAQGYFLPAGEVSFAAPCFIRTCQHQMARGLWGLLCSVAARMG